jgi:hypothetical protein
MLLSLHLLLEYARNFCSPRVAEITKPALPKSRDARGDGTDAAHPVTIINAKHTAINSKVALASRSGTVFTSSPR